MEKKILLKNGKLVLKDKIVQGNVLISNKKIEEIIISNNGEELKNIDKSEINVIDVNGKYISPGFVDIHTHGGGGADFMDNSVSSILTAVKKHMEFGTTSIVPTALTSTTEALLDFINMFKGIPVEQKGYPNILGLHLEGPYFAYEQRGAQDPKYLRDPNKEEYLKILDASDRLIRWSIAPELKNALELGKELEKRKINASIGHTIATSDDVKKAFENGYKSMTHLYSCMNSIVREKGFRIAGAVEASYLIDDMYVEVIADGKHMPKELLQFIYKFKKKDKIILVTDSMRAAGMGEGTFILGGKDIGYEVIVEDGIAKLKDRSGFAGSVATSDRLVRTMLQMTDAKLFEVVNMISLNPCRLLGIEERKGSIDIEKDADLVIFDENINVSFVMVMGNIVINKIKGEK